jgi:hypothetical protein
LPLAGMLVSRLALSLKPPILLFVPLRQKDPSKADKSSCPSGAEGLQGTSC